jgi:hypothetical protein
MTRITARVQHRDVLLAIIVLFAVIAFAPAPGSDLPQVSVTTYHNGIARQGVNAAETILRPANVNPRRFGKLFTLPVDGSVYAQPLYISALYIPGKGIHNVVFVATQHGSVYAFDADSNKGPNAAPIWKATLVDARLGATPVSSDDVACGDIVPEIGITGTPVIDIDSGMLYVVAKSKESGQVVQRLHALDVATGTEQLGGPVTIAGSVRGKGAGSSSGRLAFDPLRENQRPGLLLQNGVVYITWAAHCDGWPFHGWVMAYDTSNLEQVGIWNSTPDKQGGGIWQSGAAPAGDGEDVFFATGNGDFTAPKGGLDFGDSIIRLGWRSGSLRVLDFFTPYDEANLNAGDIEPGSGGVVLFSAPKTGHQLAVETSKSGTLYIVDPTHMGRYNPTANTNIVQSLPAATGGVWGTPAWWKDTLYVGPSYDTLKAFRFNPDQDLFDISPVSQSSTGFRFPGPTPSISSNGDRAGILWLIQTDNYVEDGPAVLRAYNASDLSQQLYASSDNPRRDDPGRAVKFAVPTIANGKVFVGTKDRVTVFGIR